MDLRIETFGGLALYLGEKKLSGFASRKAEAMLAYLASEGQAVPRSILANLFWEEASDKQASTNLRVALSSLKRQLEPFLDIGRQEVKIKAAGNFWIDILDLERCLADDDLDAGLALYRGDFLQGFHLKNCSAFEDWQTRMREHYFLRIRAALHEGVNQCMGRHAMKTALRYTRRLLDLDPYDEVALRRMMEILVRTGERNAAILQFERYEKILADDLDVSPDPATWEVFERIRNGEIPADILARSQLINGSQAKKRSRIGSLPQPPTSFVGREHELSRLEKMLSSPDVRLVTILGPGGCGKTRLGLEAGNRSARLFDYGVVFVPLVSIFNLEGMLTAIATAFGFQAGDNAPQKRQLLDMLETREMLLILDNFETVLDGASFVSEILRCTDNVKVIVTSREKLDLLGEHVFRLEGLGYPQEQAAPGDELTDSAMLFLQTAGRLNPGRKIGPEDRLEIARICRLVEGMPLALELAAAWTDTLTLHEIGNQIEAGLDILSVETRDLPQRHRSIRLMYYRTYHSLDPADQECFSKLSVFRGGFSRWAAQKVAGAGIHQLKTLARKSLLYLNDTGRYQIHELLRQFGAENLNESPELEALVKNHHSHFYREYLAGVEKQILGGRIIGLEREAIAVEIKNIRAGFRQAVETGDLETVLAYIPGMFLLDPMANQYTILDWAIDTLSQDRLSAETEIVIARLMHQSGLDKFYRGFYEEGLADIRRSIAILQKAGSHAAEYLHAANLSAAVSFAFGHDYDYDPLISAALENFRNTYMIRYALECAGTYARTRNEPDRAEAHYQNLLTVAEPLYERRWLAKSYLGLGLIAEDRGDFSSAIAYLQRSAPLYARVGALNMVGVVYKHLGILHFSMKQEDRALHYYRQSLVMFEETGLPFRVLEAYMYLGETKLHMGALEEAQEYYEKAVQMEQKVHQHPNLGFLYGDLGWLMTELADYPAAASRFLMVLQKYSLKDAVIILHAMGRSIPLLEALGQDLLAGRLAAAVYSCTASLQWNSKWLAIDHLKRVKAEQGEEFHAALMEQAGKIQLETLKDEFEAVLNGI